MLDRRARKADRSFLLLILICVVIGATALYAYLQLRVDQVTDALKKSLPLNTLFIVSDGDKVLFLEAFLYTPATKKGALFYVPANLGGVIENLKRVDGLDALYKRGNPALLTKKVEQILGTPVICVMDIDMTSMGSLVDLIGGVDLFIPNPVDLVQGGRRVLLPSGSVLLDGDKVKDFITYEDSLESESDRIGRRQKLLQSLLKGLGQNKTFLLQREPFRMLRGLLRTNLPSRALSAFLSEMGRFDSERMVQSRVLGTTRSVDGRELLFPHQEGQLIKEAVKQAMEANAANELVAPEELTLTVEVLNGTGTTGLASRARDVFQSYNLEVFAPGNADNDQYLKTVVLDRKGNIENARKVADIIRCANVYSRPEAEMDQAVDVTVIVGKDFDGRYCTQ